MDAGEALSWPRSRTSNEATAQIEALHRDSPSGGRTFPAGLTCGNGVFFRDLKPEQVEAALKVAKIALGEEGFARYQEVRGGRRRLLQRAWRPRAGGGPDQKKATAILPKVESGGEFAKKSSGGGGGMNFASSKAMNYMIAFLGKPSKTTPWILQLGGHHLRHQYLLQGNDRAQGDRLPRRRSADAVWKDDQGKTHEPLAPDA